MAKRAAVSTSTVSHVINGTRFVKPELVERVQQAMAELGYQPNAVARSLRRKETFTIGMVLPDSANPFFALIARAIEDTCFRQGYNVILANSAGDTDRELSNIMQLLQKQVDGLIIVGTGIGGEDLEQVLGLAPIVIVDRDLPGVEADAVLVDNLGGGYLATNHLIDLGHLRIACIAGPSKTTPSNERVTGYYRALLEAGISPDERLTVRGDFQFESGAERTRNLMELPHPPTALFACNDLMAVGAMAAITQMGLSIPDDVSVVGFDDVTLASYTTPPLTTVAQPVSEAGMLAADSLIRRIRFPDEPFQRHRLSTSLVIRGSAGEPPDRQRGS